MMSFSFSYDVAQPFQKHSNRAVRVKSPPDNQLNKLLEHTALHQIDEMKRRKSLRAKSRHGATVKENAGKCGAQDNAGIMQCASRCCLRPRGGRQAQSSSG